MLADLGYGILVVTFVLALYSVIAAVIGERRQSAQPVESARRAQLLTFPLLTLSAGILISLLVTNRFDVSFVYEVTSRSMPTYLKVTAWWGGQSGSLLFWAWLLSAFTSAVTLRKWERDREFLPWVIVVSSVTLAFFLSMNIFFENPFARFFQTVEGVDAYTFKPEGGIPFTPQDGQGLNPLLRHPGMIIHPPMLYLGFVSFVIPFAFAIAALATGRTDDRWTRITRRWTLWAWLFLSLGLVLGGRWAYDVLGWGGYWGWDPVEHAFAKSAIGPMFFAFIGLTFITSISLLIWRWPELKSEAEMKSMLSREALFLLNNLLFMSVLVVCFWGVIFPLISELVTGQRVTVGPPFYERANAPIFGAMMALMGIAPLSAWGKSTALTLGRALWKPTIPALFVPLLAYLAGFENWIALIGFFLVAFVIFVTLYDTYRGARARQRAQKENFFVALGRLAGRNRRRYGGYLIHISMMLMAIGIMGIELFQTEYEDGQYLGQLNPRIDFYFDSQQTMTIPGQRSTLKDDLYILLVDWQPVSSVGATFKIYHNPLVNWLWIGCLVFIAGMLFAAWPDRDPAPASQREDRRAYQPGAAD